MNSTTNANLDVLCAESVLRSLCKGKWTDLTLDLNDYVQGGSQDEPIRIRTVAESLSEEWYNPDHDDWVNEEQKQLAVEHNTFWSLMWSPDTPVGSCAVHGYNLGTIVLPEFHGASDALLISYLPQEMLKGSLTKFETRLRALLYRPDDHLHLSYNHHKSSYIETDKAVDEIRHGETVHNWATPHCRAMAMVLDSIWILSVGGIRVSSHSLLTALLTVERLALGGTANA